MKLSFADLPAKGHAAAKAEAKGTEIVGASKERDKRRIAYELETQKDSKSRDLSYDDDGNLSAVEEQMDFDDIPNPAKAALQKKAAGGTIKKIASVTARGTVSYEATIVNRSGGHTELAVNTNGSRRRD